MNAPEMMLILFAARLVLPFGILMLLGEWLRRRDQARRYRL